MLNNFTRSLKAVGRVSGFLEVSENSVIKSVKISFTNLKSYMSDCTTYVILSKLTWMRSNARTLISS